MNLPLKNKIHHQDFLQGVKEIESDSIDVIVADPPYNIGKDFQNESDSMPMDEYLKWTDEWVSECLRVLKPNGSMYIYGFSEILADISAQMKTSNKRWLVWHYTNKTIPSYNFWQRSHESILMLWKDKPIFNTDDVRESYTDAFKKADGKKRKGTKGRYGTTDTVFKVNPDGAMPRDVIKISALAGGSGFERYFWCKDCGELSNEPETHLEHSIISHPTQKPLKLTEKLLRASINKESQNTILIPFCGSGSEVLQCKRMGLDFISFEITKDYIDLANKKLELLIDCEEEQSESLEDLF